MGRNAADPAKPGRLPVGVEKRIGAAERYARSFAEMVWLLHEAAPAEFAERPAPAVGVLSTERAARVALLALRAEMGLSLFSAADAVVLPKTSSGSTLSTAARKRSSRARA